MTAIRVTLSNPAPEHQRRFATVVVPTPLCATWGKRAYCLAAEGDASGMPAVLIDQDEHGSEWAVYGSHPPAGVLRYLVAESAMPNERPWPLPKYIAHPAVYDDLGELDPVCSVEAPLTIELPKRRIAAESGEHHAGLFVSKGAHQAWHADIRLRNFSNEPFVQFSIRFIWSDLASTLTETPCTEVSFRFGEKLVLDFGPEVGWIMHEDGMGATYTPPEGVLAKGQALDVSGWLLCHESNDNGVDTPPDDPLDYHEATMREMTATANELAASGAVVGICEDWAGHLGVFGVVPELPRNHEYLWIPNEGDFYDVRPGGMPKKTGATGSQAAFGVMSHAEVFHDNGQPVHEKLRWLHWTSQRWSACTIHHRDAQGRPIAAADHPDMHEFCQLPFKTGKDFLGMTSDQWHPPPWSGEWPACDEMHDQLHPLLAWSALSRDPLARDTTACWVENRLRHVRTYIQHNLGMDRSVGRNLTNLANAGTIHGGTVKAKVIMFCQEQAVVLKANWDGKNLSGPVKPLQVQRPDPRAIIDDTGVQREFYFPLFEWLGCIGIIASSKMTGDNEVREIGLAVGRTVIEQLMWEYGDGSWEMPWELLALPDGQPLPQAIKDTKGVWQWKDGNEDTYLEQGLGGAILLRDETDDPALKARCQRLIDWNTKGQPPRRAYGSHHWCTGKRVP